MAARSLRLALLVAATAIPVTVLAACADGANDASSSDTSALTEADTARLDGLILEAFSTSTATNFAQDTLTPSLCASIDPRAKIFQWNVLGGQWFAPSLRAGLSQRGVLEQLTVVETPSTGAGLLDIQFLGTPTQLDGAAPALCGADGGTGNAVVLLTCKGVASTGMMTSIAANQCSH